MAKDNESTWTFLTNHGHVLLCIARDSRIRGRDIATQVGITERAAQSIVADLVEAGYVTRSREGRRNHYELDENLPFRHPIEKAHDVGVLLEVLTEAGRRHTRTP
ncbi:MAG: helix-turn-helix transcriptional regulator [Ferrimicrobium sp.]